jgi:succinate dehydrogenase / fumarate reductase membrane anchor subunit
MTSIALLPLGLWFLISLLRQPGLDYATVTGWLARPLQALLATLFGVAMLWHSLQGVQVVLEDYVGAGRLGLSIRISQFAHAAAAAALLFAVWRLAAAGGS